MSGMSCLGACGSDDTHLHIVHGDERKRSVKEQGEYTGESFCSYECMAKYAVQEAGRTEACA